MAERHGTLIRDTVNYEFYLAPLVRTPLLGWVHGDLRRIFSYRQYQMRMLFGSTALKE
jgi:ligand-binding SRPBCC domain-containing protein